MPKLSVNNKLKLEQPKPEVNSEITFIKDFNKFGKIYDKAIKSYEGDPNRNYKISSTYVTPKGMSRIITYDPQAKKFIAVDNRIGELYTEEFDTEEEARNFLMSDEFTGEEFKKPAPITSNNQAELEQLGKEYARYFNEYVNYDKSKGNTKNILRELNKISERVTQLVGDEKRYDVLKKYVTKYGGK